MALLNTKITRSALRDMARRELLDTGTRWWSDAELNQYIDDWQMDLQTQFEFVTAAATYTTSTNTFALSTISDLLRLDAIYWNGKRLVARTQEDLDTLNRNWRNASPQRVPVVSFQTDSTGVNFFPTPNTAGTVVFEYPQVLAFSTDTSTMQIPAWTKYSAKHYCTWKAYLRAGANQDVNRALAGKARYMKRVNRFTTIFDNYFPDRAMRLKGPSASLRVGGSYESDIMIPIASNDATTPN